MSFWDIFRISEFKSEISRLTEENRALKERLDSLGANEYFAVKEKTDCLVSQSRALNEDIALKEKRLCELNEQISESCQLYTGLIS